MDGFKVPSFDISQDDTQVFLSVQCPVQPAVAVEGNIFGLHSGDVYLPLVFPYAVTQGDVDYADGKASIILNKGRTGHWDDLEQLVPQLMPSDQMAAAQADADAGKGLFAQDDETSMAAREMLERGLRNEQLVEEDAPVISKQSQAPTTPSEEPTGYGYGLHSGFYGPMVPVGSSDLRAMLQIPNPSDVAPPQRSQIAEDHENDKWDEGIYMENHLDPDGELANLLRFEPTLPALPPSASQDVLATDSTCVLVELLFAFAYDRRTNRGEATVESGWTISQLSRSLSASAVPPSLAHTVRALLRRSLSLPLYRSWKLSQQCFLDVQQILRAGQGNVAATLQEVQSRLEATENAGIETRLVDVWVAPLLREVSAAGDAFFHALTAKVATTAQEITKDVVGGDAWDLAVIEQAAEEAFADGEGGFI